MTFEIHPLTEADRAWVAGFIAEHWGSPLMAVHGELFQIDALPGFYAIQPGDPGRACIGLVTYRLAGADCEVMSLDSLREGLGIGTALLEAVKGAAWAAGCARLVLTTTNDNLHALRFYQRRGFVLAGVRLNAIAESRRLKPEIPLTGYDGIPIRDEIDLATGL